MKITVAKPTTPVKETSRGPQLRAAVAQCLKADVKLVLGSTDGLRHSGSPEESTLVESWSLTVQAMFFSMELYTIAKVLECKPDFHVDLGCGDGHTWRALRTNYWYNPIIGIDALKRELLRPVTDSHYVQCDFVNVWPLKDASVPMVVFSEVLEHLTRDDGANTLRRIGRSLQPGGRLVLTSPAWFPDADMEYEKKKYGHLHYWKYEELEKELMRSGLHVTELFSGRFLSHATKMPTIRKLFQAKYGTTAPIDDCKARFGSVITSALFQHVVPPERSAQFQLVAVKK